MQTDDLLLCIHYWMEFGECKDLLDEISQMDTDEIDELARFSDMLVGTIIKASVQKKLPIDAWQFRRLIGGPFDF